MEEESTWNSWDWEKPIQKVRGHNEIINKLIEIFETKYNPEHNLKIEKFNKAEARIGEKHSLKKPHIYVAHTPDLIISKIDKPNNRVVIEYVNTKRNFLFDYRGMIALSNIMKASMFILAIRKSVLDELKLVGTMSKYNINTMDLKTMLDLLDSTGLNSLITIT